MSFPSQAYARAKHAFQQEFPTTNLPNYQKGQSIFDLVNTITSQTLLPVNYLNAIQHMKAASDRQEYRIQRRQLQIEKENGLATLQQICYEMHSTGLMSEKEIFMNMSEKSNSQSGDRLGNLIDEVWWNSQKNNEQHLYFLD